MSEAHRLPRSARAGIEVSAVLGLLIASVLLGGASRDNQLAAAALQIAALPVLVWSGVQLTRGLGPRESIPLVLLAAIFAIPLLQLVPLQPDLWRSLPGRAEIAETLALAGIAPEARPHTLAPAETVANLLFLLLPAAVFAGALRLSDGQALTAAMGVVVVALASLLLGVFQIAVSDTSPLYPYGPGNLGGASGVFANRNHQASLLLCAIPLVCAIAASLDRRIGADRRTALAASAVAIALLLIGLGAVRSRAGVLLAAPAIAFGLLLLWRGRSSDGRGAPIAVVAGAGGLAVLLVAALGSVAVLQRFEAALGADERLKTLPTIVALARRLDPVGGGLGSFEPLFRTVEPLDRLDNTFVNHAHNDFLELWLETGWLGPVLAVLFLAWVAFAAARAWRPSRSSVSLDLARAGTIIIALILAHSAVDYPLRTPAMAAVFAFACGLLARAPAGSEARAHQHSSGLAGRSRRRRVRKFNEGAA